MPIGGGRHDRSLLAAAAAFIDDIAGARRRASSLIGFFTGFYIVPLFTLLQHKAPKASKGDTIATSNFINVTGAILASLLFFAVVFAAQRSGLVPEVTERPELAVGTLTAVETFHGRPVYFEVTPAGGGATPLPFGERPPAVERPFRVMGLVHRLLGTSTRVASGEEPGADEVVDVDKRVKKGSQVVVTEYDLSGIKHFDVRPEGSPLDPDYDLRTLPRYLFAGAAGLTLLTLLVLIRPLRQLRRDGV